MCSVWGWGCGRDMAQRRKGRGMREWGCGTRQGHNTHNTRDGHGMRKERSTRDRCGMRKERGMSEQGCGTREGRGMMEWDNAGKQR